MTLRNARIAIVLVGIALPYVARLPRGAAWLHQYTDVGLWGWLFFGALNAIAWGAILGVSFLYRRPLSLLLPAIPGFGFLAWAHFSLDLAEDAQSAIGLLYIPIVALAPIAVGAVIGYLVDLRIRPRSAA